MDKFEVKKVSLSIDKKEILNNISFSLKTGDVMLLKGTNGSGKTTMLKSIVGYNKVKKIGSILFNNKNITNLSTEQITKLGISYISQNNIELENINTLELLKLINKVNKNYELNKFIKIVDDFFSQYHLDKDLLKRDFNVNFSGGQKKKLELLIMLIMDPKVILIDEIDSGVDSKSLESIIKFINNIKKNKIIILVSHNKNFIDGIKPNKTIQLS